MKSNYKTRVKAAIAHLANLRLEFIDIAKDADKYMSTLNEETRYDEIIEYDIFSAECKEIGCAIDKAIEMFEPYKKA